MGKTLEERLEELEKKLQEKDESIATLTKSYEEKSLKMQEDFNKRVDDLNKAHTEEIRNIVLGRKVVNETQKEKSFFKSAVEKTLNILNKK